MTDKKLALIRTALKLFYVQGIHAVGINEILKQSGIAKKTLYSYFASKDELILATLKYRDEIFVGWLRSRLEGVEPGKPALVALFHALDDWFNDRESAIGNFRGCFFINASAEYGDPESQIYLACKEHKNNVRELVKQHVDVFMSGDEQSNLLTDLICVLKEGAITTAKVQKEKQAAIKLIPTVTTLVDLESSCFSHPTAH